MPEEAGELENRVGRRSTRRVQFELPMLPAAAGTENRAEASSEARESSCQDQSIRLTIQLQRKLIEDAADVMALWMPVTLSLVTACIMTLIRRSHIIDPDVSRSVLIPEVALVATTAKSELQHWIVLLIVLIGALLMIVLVSFIMVALLSCDCFLCLRIYICISFSLLALHMVIFWSYTATGNVLIVSVDFITFGLVSYNILALTLLAIGAGSQAPKRLIQTVHILLSAVVAYIVVNFMIGNRFIYAAVICLMFSAWDLFAVLCPRGPLNSIIKLAEQKQGVTGFLQPLVYSAIAWTTMAAPDDDEYERAARPNSRRRPKRGSRLGLGDFIFYGVLTASAASQSGVQGALACYLGLFIGFCATLLALKLLDRALPALPLPVLAAVITVSLTNTVGQSFSSALMIQQIFV